MAVDPKTTLPRPVRSYAVTVEGFPEAIYVARTPSQARARCWDAYSSYQQISFGEFLKMSSIRRVPNPSGVGDRIVVSGSPATRVLPIGQYVGFMLDDSDQTLCSHPNDVKVCNVSAES